MQGNQTLCWAKQIGQVWSYVDEVCIFCLQKWPCYLSNQHDRFRSCILSRIKWILLDAALCIRVPYPALSQTVSQYSVTYHYVDVTGIAIVDNGWLIEVAVSGRSWSKSRKVGHLGMDQYSGDEWWNATKPGRGVDTAKPEGDSPRMVSVLCIGFWTDYIPQIHGERDLKLPADSPYYCAPCAVGKRLSSLPIDLTDGKSMIVMNHSETTHRVAENIKENLCDYGLSKQQLQNGIAWSCATAFGNY